MDVVKRIIRRPKILSQSTYFDKAAALAVLSAVVLVGTVIIFRSQAAGPFASLDLGAGSTVTSPATSINDGTASGGSYVQFGSTTPTPPPPPGGSRCPAYPAFPDASCTGVPSGVTLRNCDGNLNTANAVYDGCLFNGDVTMNATGVTIKNSKINGVVNGNYRHWDLVMIDVEIDGGNTTFSATNGLFGYTCIRCNVHRAGQAFYGSDFVAEDSYVHDLYGEGICEPCTHNEAVLGYAGNIVVRHSRLDSTYGPQSPGGGMSAAIALYTHGDWGPMDNVLIEKNRIATSGGYCAYGGDSEPQNPTNIRFIDNVFVRNPNGTCGVWGPITSWLRGGGNIWQNNRFDDGAIISEP